MWTIDYFLPGESEPYGAYGANADEIISNIIDDLNAYKSSIFNEKYPVNTKVKYYPLKGAETFTETTILSECWPLDSGDLVVKVAGKSGGVSIDHIAAS